MARVTPTNIFVLGALADAVSVYGAPISRFAAADRPHLRRLISFGLIEPAPGKANAWRPSAAGYDLLRETSEPRLGDMQIEPRHRRLRFIQENYRP